jgi:DNA-binding beta-propeller fold protein YncE
MRIKNKGGAALLVTMVITTGGLLCLSWFQTQSPARLVSIQQLPDSGEMCYLQPVSAIATLNAEFENNNLFSAFDETSVHAADTVEITRPPIRTIRDTYPIYSSVAVDPDRDEVVLQDTNLFAIRVFKRLENTPSGVEASQPKRVIQGPKTKNEYNNGLYIDSQNGEIYSVAMDTADNVIVFSHDADGDVPPLRVLKTPHRNFGTAIDEGKGELYVTIQYPPRVMVYSKTATGNDKPLRVIEGESTAIHDAHGIAIDVKRNLMFVGNWGDYSDHSVAGSGKFYPPSITVYPLNSNGDTAPIRVIQGPKTQLDWAGAMKVDPDTGDLYVANDVSSSILVFKETDKGDVAPSRVIKGAKTRLSHPAGLSLDLKHKELWVSNMGNSSATCYSLTANGDAAPIRTIRSAPAGYVSVKFGKPQAVAYDSKRELYLVPN